MSKYIKLATTQKEEIRRLTQLANRRITQAMKKYEEKGLSIAPKEVTGGIQTRGQWASEKYPLSRAVTFESETDYKEKLKFLKQFDPKTVGKHNANPTMTEYTKVQQKKMKFAIETATSGELTQDLIKKIDKLGSAELAKFWNGFSKVGSKLLLEYSSDALIDYSSQYFKEDVKSVILEDQ